MPDATNFEAELPHRNDFMRHTGLPLFHGAKSSEDEAMPAPPVPPRQRSPMANCVALIATRNFLPYAKLAARTFLNHHSGFSAMLLLVDGGKDDVAAFQEGEIVFLRDLGLRHTGWLSAKYTAAEFCNALKPSFLLYLATFSDKTVYLDCDIAVFSPFAEVLSLLEHKDLILIPHMLAPLPNPERFGPDPPEQTSLTRA